MRMGKKKQPTYRIVATDGRSPRDGRFIEIIGTYQPRLEPSGITVDSDKALHWLHNGAQPSDTVRKLFVATGVWSSFTGEASAPTATEPAATAAANSSSDEPSAS
jgi:small subunit ribosomal protein S16